MITLLSECHFWSSREEIRIKDTDYGAFKYLRNRDNDPDNILQQSKRLYAENRDCQVVVKNHKTSRLKDNIKKLDEILQTHKIIHSQWLSGSVLLILFSNGLIAHISVDIHVGDILCLAYDKYLIGKLAADVITDAIFTRQHIIVAYSANQVTIIYLQKPNEQPAIPEKIVNMDPKIVHVLVPGTPERRLPRRLAVNPKGDMIALWTRSSQNEVFPWRPTVRDQDRANIHVFKIKNIHLEAISYCWSENDPLRVDFLRSSESQIFTIEQRISRKGEVSAEVCSYELNEGKMQRAIITSIPMGTQICCFEFSPDQEKLFLGTIDRYVCIHDLVKQTSRFLPKIEIIPTDCSWHADSSLIIIANTRAQFQCFDSALQPIANQLISEDVTPLNLLDLSHYFTVQPLLLNVSFSRKPELQNFPFPFAQTDCFLLLVFENGPLACLRFVYGAGMLGDFHNSGLTSDVILDRYLSIGQLEKAVTLIQSINWETYGAICLLSLHKVANFVFSLRDVKRHRLELLSKALKTFTDGLSEETKDEFSDQVYDIKRRYFFFLLRNNFFPEAFVIAQDIEDYDLFMDLYESTRLIPEYKELANETYAQAELFYDESCSESSETETSSESTSPEPPCHKESIDEYSNRSTGQWNQVKNLNTLKNYVPPLPSFKSKVLNAENIKINTPSPEFQVPMSTDPSLPSTSRAATIARTKQHDMDREQSLKITVRRTLSTLPHEHSESKPWNRHSPVIPKVEPWSSNPTKASVVPRKPQVHELVKVFNNELDGTPQQRPNATNLEKTSAHAPPLPDLHNLKLSNPHDSGSPTWPQIPDYGHNGPPLMMNAPVPFNILPRASANPAYVETADAIDLSSFHTKFYQHPLVSGTIPPTTLFAQCDDIPPRLPMRKPTASILSNGISTTTSPPQNGIGITNGTLLSKKDSGEKNKVKFSDTVQVAVVPEIPRKEKPLPPKRNGYTRTRHLTNPKKELADSLPLCHPHDDYLKDFNPMPDESQPRSSKALPLKDGTSTHDEDKGNPTIKVVHFGVV